MPQNNKKNNKRPDIKNTVRSEPTEVSQFIKFTNEPFNHAFLNIKEAITKITKKDWKEIKEITLDNGKVINITLLKQKVNQYSVNYLYLSDNLEEIPSFFFKFRRGKKLIKLSYFLNKDAVSRWNINELWLELNDDGEFVSVE